MSGFSAAFLVDLCEIVRIARRAMKRETVSAILLGLMAALPFGLLQHNWVLAICFGVLVGFGMAGINRMLS
jgi:hypothetical protein